MILELILENWLLLFFIATITVPITLFIGFKIIMPFAITKGYKRALNAKNFQVIDGSEGAGSIDIKYFNLYFDVRKNDVIISGQVPESRYWHFGAFNGSTRIIDGAFINHNTIKIDEHNRFEICLTANPSSCKMENIMDCSKYQCGMIIYRIVLPQKPIPLPEVRFQNNF